MVVNFLAHLFQDGYQCRSLNVYRSTISSMLEKVDGYEVGQHPLVARLLGCSGERFTSDLPNHGTQLGGRSPK